MSKTYKDAPEWVRASREKFHFKYVHSSYLIGRQYKQKYYVIDPDGNYVIEKEYIERVNVYEDYLIKVYNDDGSLNHEYLQGRLKGFKDVKRYVYATEDIVYKEYEDHCTCGVSKTGYNRMNSNGKYDPCYIRLTKAKKRSWYDITELDEASEGHQVKAKQDLKQVVKKFNSSNFIEDEDVPETLYQNRKKLFWYN